ncbi:hypothetical protein N0V90_011179 [Kalmusia sp. IMI 367209]|nr:hypothetical protein N0V90_011179 [Kalmusia sp. IMI 367209]
MAPDRPDLALDVGLGLEMSDASAPSMDRFPDSLFRNRRNLKTRLGLPLTFGASNGPATVLACADTGSEENIISDGLARSLGYASYEPLPEPKHFMLANGKIVEAIGQIAAQCSFGMQAQQISTPMACLFYVLVQLASPLILGMTFLEETKTLTQHRDRLVRVPRPMIQALRVYSVGRPSKQLHCKLNNWPVLVTPDSGSEIDLMSERWAQEHELTIEYAKELIEFADGTTAITLGSVQATLSVIKSDHKDTSPGTQITLEFLILKDLTHDVIIGEDSIEELQVFTTNHGSLYRVSDATGPLGLNRIRYLGAIDGILEWVRQKLGSHNRDGQARSRTNYKYDKQPDVATNISVNLKNRPLKNKKEFATLFRLVLPLLPMLEAQLALMIRRTMKILMDLQATYAIFQDAQLFLSRHSISSSKLE